MPGPAYMAFNGEIVPSAEARVHVDTPFCKYGVAVFEGICGYRSDDGVMNLFRLQDHLDRLRRSAALMRIPDAPDHATLTQAIRTLLAANTHPGDVHLRLLLWLDGNGELASEECAGWSIASVDRAAAKSGLRVSISSWVRADDKSAPPRIKCVANYAAGRLALMQARLDGYDSTLLLDRQGHVSEAPTSCVFFRIGGKMVTPRPTDSILESVTRNTILHQLALADEPVEIRSIDRTEAYLAEEAFLCGSAVEILPIVEVDGFPIGSGSPGPMTRRITQSYLDVVRARAEAPEGWLAAV